MVLLLLLLLWWYGCCSIIIIAIAVVILLTGFLQEDATVHVFNFVLSIFKKDTMAWGVTYIHRKHYWNF